MGLKERVQEVLGEYILDIVEYRGDITIEVPRSRILEVLRALKESDGLQFNFLVDIVGVDNSALYEKKKARKKKPKGEGEATEKEPVEEGPPPPRFEVIYLLLALSANERLRVKIRVPEDDSRVDSITVLWRGADWAEREIYDMFGISFKGHPNLKRLLMWEGFPAHPLRKDYPLEGQGEQRDFDDCRLF